MNKKHEIEIKEYIFKLFNTAGWNAYLVELTASLNIRLQRNKSENRLLYKLSKRGYITSDAAILSSYENNIFDA